MKTLSKRTSGNRKYSKVVDTNESIREMNSNTKNMLKTNKLIQETIKKIYTTKTDFFCGVMVWSLQEY